MVPNVHLAASNLRASAGLAHPLLNDAGVMLRPAVATLVLVFLFTSCASAPASKPDAPPAPKVNKPPATRAAPASDGPPAVARVEEARPALGPGQCVDGFDCVDTVGFPPAGQRWACVAGKCTRAKLPSLGGEDAAAANTPTPPSDAKQVSKKGNARAR
jgi:hypothetical protein